MAVPGPSPSSAPASEPALRPEDAPEIAAGLVSGEDRDRYVRFIQALRQRDATAAEWLTGTGLFLKDARLDGEELQVMDMIQGRPDDPLWYLSHVRIMDGISSHDLAYLQSNSATPGENWYFDDDIDGLDAHQLLSPEGRRSLQRIFERGRHEPEVRRGLYLVNTLGLPESRAFKYPVPVYNAHLYLLARLLERGVPGEYERAAIAASLTYGSLMTLCEEEAREEVVAYASERLRLLIDGDVLLAAAGAGWRAVDYSLEMLMVVLWGGQSTAYPQPGLPPAQAPGLGPASEHPLTRADLARLLVEPANLRQMQDEMLRVVVERTADEAMALELLEQWWSGYRRDEADEGGPDLNQQWARFLQGRGFAGGAEAAYVLQGLAASINLPLPWAQLWYAHKGQLQVVPFGLWLDPAAQTIRLGDSALRATASLPAGTQAVLVWYRVPWDNWHLRQDARTCQTVPLPLLVWRAGIPAGYLLRSGAATEAEALAALGLASPTTERKP